MSTERIQQRKAQIAAARTSPIAAEPLPDLPTTTTATPIEHLPAYLTTAQAATYLQLARRTVANWCDDGTLQAVKVGDSWRIPKSEMIRLLTPQS